MATFTELCKVENLPPGTMKGFSLGDRVVLLANVEGKVYAVDGICPHMSGYLPQGKLEGADLVCPVHGSHFDVRTGKVTQNIPWIFKRLTKTEARDLKTYTVRVEGGTISVSA